MPIAVIALSTLSLASQAIASQAIAYLIYSSPTATTVWTAGQPATVSWANSCNEVVGNTTFPIYIMAPVGDTSDIIGYLDCKMPGTSNVMVRATLPQGPYFISVSTGAFTGGFSSRSDSFLILASTSGSTTTILSTTILPTTTVILTTTSPANPTGSSPAASNEGDDTKSNGAVIGGSIAAAVIAGIYSDITIQSISIVYGESEWRARRPRVPT
ncbi:hypothetical protein BGZ47_002210 [Haplosporangium gracile]|nr:hypothetical protein BGZ47_002210 [Haplosporangium gracile]